MSHRFPLATSSWGNSEYSAMQRVIASGMFTMSEEVAKFERQFAEFFGSRFAVMVNSGSSANLLMVAAMRYTKNPELNLQPDDEIIVPAVSWSTSYYPFAQYGLKMRFVDIDLHTLNYNLEDLEMAITPATRAILAVNLLGNPNDFEQMRALIGDRPISILEDNCESMGATLNGKHAGTFGVMGTFSCFFSHHISTMEGGMIVTDDEELFHVLLCLRAHGWTRNLPKYNQVTGEKSDDPFEESFKFVLPGYNVRPLEISGAIGQEQLKRLPDLISGRRANAKGLVDKVGASRRIMLQEEVGNSSWFGFSLVLRPEYSGRRAELISDLRRDGFEVRPIVGGNFAKNPVMNHFNYSVYGELKNADYIDANGVFIGNHHYPIPEAIEILSGY